MGLIGRILLFAARECARPCLEKIGEQVGDAIGTVIGKRIDPNHGATEGEDAEGPDVDSNPRSMSE